MWCFEPGFCSCVLQIPSVLQPYMHGQDFIPFRRTLAQTGLLVSSALRHTR